MSILNSLLDLCLLKMSCKRKAVSRVIESKKYAIRNHVLTHDSQKERGTTHLIAETGKHFSF